MSALRSVWMCNFQKAAVRAAALVGWKARGVRRVFLSLPKTWKASFGSELPEIVGDAHDAGIEVHAMTLEDADFLIKYRDSVGETLAPILKYCDNHSEASFDGVHLDVEPHAHKDWHIGENLTEAQRASNDALLARMLEVFHEVRDRVDAKGLPTGWSGQPFQVSAAVAWWAPHYPSGQAANLVGHGLDFVVPMIYDGAGPTVALVKTRAQLLMGGAPTVVGIGAGELKQTPPDPGRTPFETALRRLEAELPGTGAGANYRGLSAYRYQDWPEPSAPP
jgi:hypothetical protein